MIDAIEQFIRWVNSVAPVALAITLFVWLVLTVVLLVGRQLSDRYQRILRSVGRGREGRVGGRIERKVWVDSRPSCKACRRNKGRRIHSSGSPALRRPSNRAGRFGAVAITNFIVSLGLSACRTSLL